MNKDNVTPFPENTPLPSKGNGYGVAVALIIFGVLLAFFPTLFGMSGWLIWVFRGAGLVFVFTGSIGWGLEYDRARVRK